MPPTVPVTSPRVARAHAPPEETGVGGLRKKRQVLGAPQSATSVATAHASDVSFRQRKLLPPALATSPVIAHVPQGGVLALQLVSMREGIP